MHDGHQGKVVVVHVAAGGFGRVKRRKKLQASTLRGSGAVSSDALEDLLQSTQCGRPVVVMRFIRRHRPWQYDFLEEDVTDTPKLLRAADEGAAPRCRHLACNTGPFQDGDHVTDERTAFARDMSW